MPLPKGFDIIIDYCRNGGDRQYSTAELTACFTSREMTTGVAAGTIRRATEQNLLIKQDYGVYTFNPDFGNHDSENAVKTQLKSCVQASLNLINEKFPATSFLSMNDRDLETVRTVLKKLQEIENNL